MTCPTHKDVPKKYCMRCNPCDCREAKNRIAEGLWKYRLLRSEDDSEEDKRIQRAVDDVLNRVEEDITRTLQRVED